MFKGTKIRPQTFERKADIDTSIDERTAWHQMKAAHIGKFTIVLPRFQ